ncbi:hypothetical protein FQA39_LY09966 [Lamprigera yunnana]|nr:hypothetical protein FQA39_LY09966 [Lamprigera yunnana]
MRNYMSSDGIINQMKSNRFIVAIRNLSGQEQKQVVNASNSEESILKEEKHGSEDSFHPTAEPDVDPPVIVENINRSLRRRSGEKNISVVESHDIMDSDFEEYCDNFFGSSSDDGDNTNVDVMDQIVST